MKYEDWIKLLNNKKDKIVRYNPKFIKRITISPSPYTIIVKDMEVHGEDFKNPDW